MSTYIDTSAFLAVSNANDPQHTSAAALWNNLLRNGESVVTSNYVAVETITLLHRRHGLPAVRRFVDDLLPVVLIEWVDPSVHVAALSAVLASSSRRGPSLVDCGSFEVIRRSGIDHVFAYDQHFRDRGFALVGDQK